jgi:hypothetical protein
MYFDPAMTAGKNPAEYNEARHACQYFFSFTGNNHLLRDLLIFL